ncbi:16S rRNA (guanine(527)-N(7))-methyltransferase RsmG [Bogoriella caseilytica]|uniref:Ribosomal RNA small subunit methyltransferase G n=1 Tax=Bogoriella caseilytica TaxID=56055 RepID=A0A3N2BCE1_9MICO|nr:16S rRNA (guanine(527)-N(7))-methyltransferase RsmG [Bogoriella caseilytica]ROR72937.1 16S rRNA (guanine527-N7)-methyltransferase [Bogoriella caseilytica]
MEPSENDAGPNGGTSDAGDAPEGGTVEEASVAMRDVFGLAWAPVQRFAELLVAEGELRGLIGPRELPRLWSRHLANSAAVAPYVGEDDRVADIGSGAGFPGIVLAAMRPDAEVHLLEPMERRVVWLEEVVEELGLENVVIQRVRAEELHRRERFDVVTARAVAAMDKLARVAMPLVNGGGRLVALKGQRAEDEVESAKYVLRKLGAVETSIEQVDLGPEVESATVVLVTKRG